MKKFIITIDTEGDNLWNWKEGMPIFTKNIKYLPRFQQLCESYGFKPVWLTNYEMIMDTKYVDFITDIEDRKVGELGMHLHAWNSPPYYALPIVQDGQPYLIEYPTDVMEEKIAYMTNLIIDRCGVRPCSHRAGRWAMNDDYFKMLVRYRYTVDCSYTPHENWKSSIGRTDGSKGCDYTNCIETAHFVHLDGEASDILEVPMTTRYKKVWINSGKGMKSIARTAYHALKGKMLWMRPNGNNINDIIKLIQMEQNSEYIMFMMHSSEFMPGGSPTFQNSESVEKLYKNLIEMFDIIAKTHEGITLREFYKMKKE